MSAVMSFAQFSFLLLICGFHTRGDHCDLFCSCVKGCALAVGCDFFCSNASIAFARSFPGSHKAK